MWLSLAVSTGGSRKSWRNGDFVFFLGSVVREGLLISGTGWRSLISKYFTFLMRDCITAGM